MPPKMRRRAGLKDKGKRNCSRHLLMNSPKSNFENDFVVSCNSHVTQTEVSCFVHKFWLHKCFH